MTDIVKASEDRKSETVKVVTNVEGTRITFWRADHIAEADNQIVITAVGDGMLGQGINAEVVEYDDIAHTRRTKSFSSFRTDSNDFGMIKVIDHLKFAKKLIAQ